MGWRSQENYELKSQCDFKRRPWRERYALRRLYWAVTVVTLFVLYALAQFG